MTEQTEGTCPRCNGTAIDPEHSAADGIDGPAYLEPCIGCTPAPDPVEPENPAAWALARHIADHPVSDVQAAFRYLNAPITIELHEVPELDHGTPEPAPPCSDNPTCDGECCDWATPAARIRAAAERADEAARLSTVDECRIAHSARAAGLRDAERMLGAAGPVPADVRDQIAEGADAPVGTMEELRRLYVEAANHAMLPAVADDDLRQHLAEVTATALFAVRDRALARAQQRLQLADQDHQERINQDGELRDQIAAAIWERQNPGRRYADCEHPWMADAEEDAGAVLQVPAIAEALTAVRQVDHAKRVARSAARDASEALTRLLVTDATVERVRAECDRIETAVRANPTNPDFDGAYLAAIGHICRALIPTCPTCGPFDTERHPRLPVTRCSNCKEHLAALDPQEQP